MWRTSATSAQLGARVIMDTLATLVDSGHLGTRLTRSERERAEAERNQAAEAGGD